MYFKRSVYVFLFSLVFSTFILLGVSASSVGTENVGSTRTVELSVKDYYGADRVNEPVRTGVPFARAELMKQENVRLLNSIGNEVPADFKVIDRWKEGSIRWILVDFISSVDADSTETYYLEYGPSVSRTENTPEVLISENPDSIVLHTGVNEYVLNRSSFSLFESVRDSEGNEIFGSGGLFVKGSADRTFSTQALFDEHDITDTFRIGFPKNVRVSESALTEDWTIIMTDHLPFGDHWYEVYGSETGYDGRGRVGGNFVSDSGRISILNFDSTADWTKYRDQRSGDKYHFSTYTPGTNLTETVIKDMFIEEDGMHTVVYIEGDIKSPDVSYGALQFTSRMHFIAGSPEVYVDFRLENNHLLSSNSQGNSAGGIGGNINQPTTYFFEDFTIYLDKTSSGDLEYVGENIVIPTGEDSKMYQESSGGYGWNYKHNLEPRHSSYVTFRGFKVYDEGSEIFHGNRSHGGMKFSGNSGETVNINIRDFWRNFPNALRSNDTSLEVSVFPGEYPAEHPLRAAEYKRHTFMFNFGGEESRDSAISFQYPLLALASPEYYANTTAIWYFLPKSMTVSNYTGIEGKNRATIDHDFSVTSKSIVSERDRTDFYGWNDYGDVRIDFETYAGQWNLKYDYDFGMMLQFFRTLNMTWWDFGWAGTRHKTDIDVSHQQQPYVSSAFSGGTWEHSIHGDEGNENPNRNRLGMSTDLGSGTRAALLGYRFTGDAFLRDSGWEMTQSTLHQSGVYRNTPGSNYFNQHARGQFQAMSRLMAGYDFFNASDHEEFALAIVNNSQISGNRNADIDFDYDVPEWNAGYIVHAARFVELYDDESMLWKVDNFTDAIVVKEDGAGCYTASYGDGNRDFYDLLAADALAYAYLVTNNESYFDHARKAFSCGQTYLDYRWSTAKEHSYLTQQYSQAASLWGNVFMYAEQIGPGDYCVNVNGIVEGTEKCDSSDLQGLSCEDFGYDGGSLGCSDRCGFDVSGCYVDDIACTLDEVLFEENSEDSGVLDIFAYGNNCDSRTVRFEVLSQRYKEVIGEEVSSAMFKDGVARTSWRPKKQGIDYLLNTSILHKPEFSILSSLPDDVTPEFDTESYCPFLPDPGLISYWSFENDFGSHDFAGTNHGAFIGTEISSGKIGNGLYFSNYGGRVDFGDIIFDNSDEFSISLWAKIENLSHDNTFITKGEFSHLMPIVFWRDDIFSVSDEADVVSILLNGTDSLISAHTSPGSFNDSNWHHVVATFESGSQSGMKIYIDGVLETTESTVGFGRLLSNSRGVHLGAPSDRNPTKAFEGTMDEVSIWSRVLNETEIGELYSNGLGLRACLLGGEIEYEDEDVNRDRKVDLADLVYTARSIGDSGCSESNNYCNRVDVNRSGSVNIVDLIIIVLAFI